MIAEHFGVLPDQVETEMSEYWLEHAWEYLQGKAIADKARADKLAKK